MKALVSVSDRADRPNAMTELPFGETIISRQLKIVSACGAEEAVLVAGRLQNQLQGYCMSLHLPLRLSYEKDVFSVADDDMILISGNLVFEKDVLSGMLSAGGNRMAALDTDIRFDRELKAVVSGGMIRKIGTEYEDGVYAAQPLYIFEQKTWTLLKSRASGRIEDAFNEISDKCHMRPFDFSPSLCYSVDTAGDVSHVSAKLRKRTEKTVYVCIGGNAVSGDCVSAVKKAAALGKVTAGIPSDGDGLLPFGERKELAESIKGISRVVCQSNTSAVIRALKPDFVVLNNELKPSRSELLTVVEEYGGRLIE